jgi:hypothetical protein
MNEYIELLTKIKDAVISPTTTDGTFETIRSMFVIGIITALVSGMLFVMLEEKSNANNFLVNVKGVSSLVFLTGIAVVIVALMSAVIRSNSNSTRLSDESTVAISNYLAKMNDQEYSRLEKLVKLYGNNLSSNDKTIKQVNKHLVETIGK